jgi:hypothetical protein
MRATTEIINILTACGCKPSAHTAKNGNTVIRINAPVVKEDSQK